MEDNLKKFSVLKIASCCFLDIAIVLAYFKIFSLYVLISPVKSTIILAILLITLAIINIVIIASNLLNQMLGVQYYIAIVFVSTAYAILANIIALVIIPGGISTLIIWEFLLLALLLGIVSILFKFSTKIYRGKENDSIERKNTDLINIRILNLEELIRKKVEDDLGEEVKIKFRRLKERINASTPFGRKIQTSNSLAYEYENKILDNLDLIEDSLINSSNNMLEILDIINETLEFVKMREKLIVN